MISKIIMKSILILFMAGILGCGSETPSSIKGSITLDEKPLLLGNLTFIPINPQTNKKTSAAVSNGAYNLENQEGFLPGSYRVEINWARGTGKKIPSADPGILMEQTIQGTISEEIRVEKGSNEKNFILKSK